MKFQWITRGEAYVRQGIEDYEQKHRKRKRKNLEAAAKSIGLQLIQMQKVPELVS